MLSEYLQYWNFFAMAIMQLNDDLPTPPRTIVLLIFIYLFFYLIVCQLIGIILQTTVFTFHLTF